MGHTVLTGSKTAKESKAPGAPDKKVHAASESPHLGGIITSAGRHILGIAIFFVGVGWAFRMIRRIFDTFHGCRFYSLICVGQFFHRFFIRIANFREPLRTHALSRAGDTYLCRIIAQFVQLRLQIAFTLGRAFV